MEKPKPVGIIPFIAVYIAAALFLPLDGGQVSSQDEEAKEVDPRRIANYQIEVSLDPRSKTLEGKETITWINPSEAVAEDLKLHLYMNAFSSPDTRFMRGRRGWRREDAGRIDIRRLMLRLPGEESFLKLPESRYSIDETVMTIPLPEGRKISRGEKVEISIEFVVKLPRIFARTGYSGNYFLVAQWFPKMGVFSDGRWVCPQYHRHSEFFADFGEYNVRITVPKNYRIGATGILMGESTSGQVTTYSFSTEVLEEGGIIPVHDFAWAAGPNFRLVEREITFEADETAHKVDLCLLMQRDRMDQAGRYEEAIRRSLEHFGRYYGPYPYSKLTVVDPGPGRGQNSGGMEYPMFITGGSKWLTTYLFPGDKQIEGVTAHEFAHQYWYGLVASDEFNEAWIDEGLTTYSSDKVIDSFGAADADCRYPKLLAENFFRLHPFKWHPTFTFDDLSPLLKLGLPSSTLSAHRHRYLLQPDADPVTAKSYRPYNSLAYSISAYDKPALMLRSLEHLLGEETVHAVLRQFYENYRFKHPTGKDFREIASNLAKEIAGESRNKYSKEVLARGLDWFFDQLLDGTGYLDYAVTDVRYRPQDGGQYLSEVVVERLGEVIVPQKIRVTLADGTAIDFQQWNRTTNRVEPMWDEEFSPLTGEEGIEYKLQEGLQGRWLRIHVLADSPVRSAQADPDYGYLLDTDFANNSYSLQPDRKMADRATAGWIRVLSRWLHGMSAYN